MNTENRKKAPGYPGSFCHHYTAFFRRLQSGMTKPEICFCRNNKTNGMNTAVHDTAERIPFLFL